MTTLSTDGLMLTWTLDMLSNPRDECRLVLNESEDLTVMSSSVYEDKLIIGNHNGGLSMVNVVDRAGVKRGVDSSFRIHDSCVTGIDWKGRGEGGSNYDGGMTATCSTDWSVKIWKDVFLLYFLCLSLKFHTRACLTIHLLCMTRMTQCLMLNGLQRINLFLGLLTELATSISTI